MSEYLHIYEVGPRDGLQNEAAHVPTAGKLKLIDGLVDAGLHTIEAASFVHPKLVPQMADAEAVMTRVLSQYDNTIQFVSLVLNEKGYDRAYATGSRRMAFGLAVSDTMSRRNSGMPSQQAMQVGRRLLERARQDGVWLRVYLITAWVCPFEGPVSPRRTIAFAEQLWEMGAPELAVADTIGHAHPLEVGWMMEELGRRLDMSRLAVHLHDTQAMGLANAGAAIRAGVRILDSSVGGLGGCPFAPGAAGNLATEDLVFMAYKMGMGTGVDFNKLWQVVYQAEEMVGRPIGGRIRSWWEANCDTLPVPPFA
ncbi:MAG: hydroxymethylglutaryl-CoA lyase [Ardenticatenales bacterium]|nr:hydroxymethylglutaryl-CoA lyase [Ardenticatenales bacterium]